MSVSQAVNYVQHVIAHKTLFTHRTSDPEFDRPAKMVAETLKDLKAINTQAGCEKFISSYTKLAKAVCDYFNDKDSDLVVSDGKDFRSRQETLDSDCRRRLSARFSEEIIDIVTHKIEMLEKIEKNCETRQKLKGELDHYASKVDGLKNNPKEDPNDQKLSESRRQVQAYDEVVKDQLKHYEKYHADLIKAELGIMKSIEREFFENAAKIVGDFDSSPDTPEFYDPPKHDVTPNINMSMTGMYPGMGQMMPGQMMPGQMMPGMYPGMTAMPGQMMPGMYPGMTAMPGQMMPGQMSMGPQGQMTMNPMQGMSTMPPPMPQAPSQGQTTQSQAQALYEFAASSPEEMSLAVGDLITVIKEDPSGWWTGACNGKTGMFPGNYVQKL